MTTAPRSPRAGQGWVEWRGPTDARRGRCTSGEKGKAGGEGDGNGASPRVRANTEGGAQKRECEKWQGAMVTVTWVRCIRRALPSTVST